MSKTTTAVSDGVWLRTCLTFVVYALLHAAAVAVVGPPPVAESIGAIVLAPVGLLTAALLLTARERWAAILCAAVAAHLLVGVAEGAGVLRVSVVAGAVVVLAALVGASFMRWRRGTDMSLSSLSNIVWLLLPTAIAAALCAAIVAVAGHAVIGGGDGFRQDWVRWFGATYLGVITVTPFLYSWGRAVVDRDLWPSRRSGLTGAVLVSTFSIACYAVLLRPIAQPVHALQLPIVLLPFLVWAVFVFGTGLVALCVALLTGFAILGSSHGMGIFALAGPAGFQSYGALQVFLVVSAFATLILAAAVNEWRTSADRLRAGRERYRAYVENSTEAIWCMELDKPMPVTLPRSEQLDWIANNARVTEANEAAERLHGAYGGARPFIGRLLAEDEFYRQPHNRDNFGRFVDEDYRIRGVRWRLARPDDGDLVIDSNVVGHLEDGLLTRIWGTDVDITARLAAQAALAEVEERFAKAFHSTPISVTLTDLDRLVIIDVNRGFERLHGYGRDEVVGRPSADFRIWADQEQRQRFIEEIRREGVVRDVEMEYRTKDGRIGRGLFSAEVFELGNRNVVVSNIQDITDLRMAEQALRQSEERFFKTFNKSPDPIVISKLSSERYVDVNEAFEQFSGYRREEVVGRTAEELGRWIDPQQRARLREVFLKRGSVSNIEVAFRTRSGETQVGLVSAESVDMSGETYVVSTIRDLTEQRRAESALVKSRELVTKAFRNSPDAIVISEMADGRILEVNEGFLNMTGLARSDVIGEHAPNVGYWKDLSQRVVVLDAIRKEGRLSQVEVEYLDQSGEVITVSYSGELIEMDGKICIVSVSRDITERKRIEHVLHAYQARLKTLASKLTLAEEDVRRKTATELHDGLCQDMAAMIMRLGVHRGSLDRREQIESVDSVLEVLKCAMRSARGIVNDLSQQQMVERGLAPAIRSLAESVAEHDGFEFELVDDENPRPLADSVRIVLFRSVRELLSNVSKHARAGQVVIRIDKRGDTVAIAVSDDGIGFDADQVDSDLGVDSGFGLFSIRQQVEWLGGSVDVHSEVGSGTIVTLTVPLDYSYATRGEAVELH